MKGSPIVALFVAAAPVTAYTWPDIHVPNAMECVGEAACKHQPKIIEGSSTVSATAVPTSIYDLPRST